MDLFAQFKAAFKRFTGKDLSATAEKPELSAEDISALEASATEVETLRADNSTLKDQNQEHATTIADLETAAVTATEARTAASDKVKATLEKFNVPVAADADVLTVANETLEAWAKKSGLATSSASETADDLGDGTPSAEFSETDQILKEIKEKNDIK